MTSRCKLEDQEICWNQELDKWRAGKTWLATVFYNESSLSLARPLAELMQEANQEVPAWLTRYASRAPYGGNKNRRSGGGRFGGRGFRRKGSRFM
ncbi:hypothetical protein CRYUN_Cryun36dG0039100 [Craigia yunnanensis]